MSHVNKKKQIKNKKYIYLINKYICMYLIVYTGLVFMDPIRHLRKILKLDLSNAILRCFLKKLKKIK